MCDHTFNITRRPRVACLDCWRKWDDRQQRMIDRLIEQRNYHARVIGDFISLANPNRVETW